MARPILTLTTPLTSAIKPDADAAHDRPTWMATNSSARTDPVRPAFNRSACTRSMSLDGIETREGVAQAVDGRAEDAVDERRLHPLDDRCRVRVQLGLRTERPDEVQPLRRPVRAPCGDGDADEAEDHERDAHQRNEICRVHETSPPSTQTLMLTILRTIQKPEPHQPCRPDQHDETGTVQHRLQITGVLHLQRQTRKIGMAKST